MRREWWVFAPIGLSTAVVLFLYIFDLPIPAFYVQADVWVLILGGGLLFSALIALFFWYQAKTESVRRTVSQNFLEDRNRFLHRLDHELKNPITAILAGLANLSVAKTATDHSGSLQSVQSQVGRLRRLIAELRKLSELETRPLELETIELTVFLEDVFELAKDNPEAGARSLTISLPRAPWPLPSIRGDRDLLTLAIHNLLENAIKFSQPGDTIELRASEDSTHAVIEIADTGPGIPSTEQSFIWEELYRGKNAHGIPGSGLGLALVRAIIARHGGDIVLRSRDGEGTVFTIRLPGNM
ncbi:MAG: HAMP domain-containing histidine kinase [Chloroflexi bacterium]|nr:HAMP domain-containing histidine kinase [Chloroflexota bacterium]